MRTRMSGGVGGEGQGLSCPPLSRFRKASPECQGLKTESDDQNPRMQDEAGQRSLDLPRKIAWGEINRQKIAEVDQ